MGFGNVLLPLLDRSADCDTEAGAEETHRVSRHPLSFGIAQPPADAFRLSRDLLSLSWFLDDYDPEEAARQAAGKEVAIVFIMADSGEGESHCNACSSPWRLTPGLSFF